MTKKIKYPRTPHLPWSPGNSSDDLILKNTKHFEGKEIIVTEKMDGENTTMYKDHIHARSITSRPHASRTWVKKLHANIAHLIPDGWRFCGENVYARHSIAYENLSSYFYLFAIWDDQNRCLSWPQTMEWAALLDLKLPREFFHGLWREELISKLSVDIDHCEGFVVRTLQGFSYEDFDRHVAKWVRKNHITTDPNWMNQEIITNHLA